MKNKLIITAIMYFVMAGFVQAQSRQSDTATYRTIIPVEKQSLMKNVDIIANMQMGLRNDFQDGDYL
jgi:hypothetical protein